MNFKKEEATMTRNKGTQVDDFTSAPKKSQDMLTKAKNKFFNIGEALKTNKILNGEVEHQKKSKTQATLDYLFKPCPNKFDRNPAISNTHKESPKRALSLQKQNSVGSYPITVDVTRPDEEEVIDSLDELKFSMSLHEKGEEHRETAALALERPRKKLSFREPEISACFVKSREKGAKKPQFCDAKSGVLRNNNIRQSNSCENLQLESQAMRVVRTVGQAFEVCHKLSINAPEVEHDEHEILTQDLLSDHNSDLTSDKPKKDLLAETISDKNSLHMEENILEELNFNDTNKLLRISQAEIQSTPTANCNRKINTNLGEAYGSHLVDELQTGGSGSGSMGNTTIFSTGSAVSTQHEIQLLKEQLELQSQQTQAALAQLQLVREQLASEQSARMEAQARTHQLLVHNKELLDHIAALVSHLQGGEQISAQPNTGPHVTMPQQHNPVDGYLSEPGENASVDQSPIIQSFGIPPQSLIENRMVGSCLPTSPLRSNFNSSGSVFNFSYPTLQDTSFEGQLLHRLQALSGCASAQYPFNYQTLIQPNLYAQPLMNNVYSLQPPPQKKLTTSPLATMKPYAGSPLMEKRPSPGRGSDYQLQQEKLSQNSLLLQNQSKSLCSQIQPASPSTKRREPQFIKPLSQLGTLTTTDVQGKVRMIVPIPSRSPDDDAGNLLASMRLGDDFRPAITRSTSEKVPNRSELMSQVQRTAWARHTTK